MSAVTKDIREQLERRRTGPERPRLTEGPVRVSGPSRLSVFWWWLRLSRLGIRIMLQEARKAGREMNTPESWANANTGWTVFLRNCSIAIAMKRAQEQEPAELARLRCIPAWDDASKAVFLSRFYPVPKPNEAGPATWSREQLPELARWVAGQVDADSDAWPHYPDGWRESLEEVRGVLKR